MAARDTDRETPPRTGRRVGPGRRAVVPVGLVAVMRRRLFAALSRGASLHILPLSMDLRGDLGTRGLEQARADAALEAEWRRRVSVNRTEVCAIARRNREVGYG